MKYSRQREMILDIVRQNPIHPTADAVYEQVRSIDPKVSLGTVYRNLNMLSEIGMLTKIPMPCGGDRFDGRMDNHVHIICSSCGGVKDVEIMDYDHLFTTAHEQTGFKVNTCAVVFTGVCKNCLSNQI